MPHLYRYVVSFIFLLASSFFNSVFAQVYPVQVTPQLIPPYSVYLSDYATDGNEKLRVIVLQRDLSRPAYPIRLSMTVEWNGRIILRTTRAFNPQAIYLNPGIPMAISGAELAPYLDSRNLDFIGIDRAQYERTRALPEGQYRIAFTAYDYYRPDVPISAEGNSFYYLTKSEPPMVNFPACGMKIAMKTPQQIVFSWMPRNTASPNSALDTEYEFSLYETRPAGRNPNDVVLTTQPVFKTTVEQTQLIYGPAEPLLLAEMNYIWRVQAIDRSGRDAFRNNGFSEVCSFYYGGPDVNFEVGSVNDLRALPETKNRAKIWWTPGMYDGYRVEYRKTGDATFEWFRSETTTGEVKLFDLEPDTEYETRLQAKKSGFYGPYSDIIKFRMLPDRAAQCGEPAKLPDLNNPGPPLTNAIAGMVVNARGVEMTLMQVTPLEIPGWYKGIGRVTLDYFLGLSYGATFSRLYINESRDVIFGRIDIMSKGTPKLVEQQVVEPTNTGNGTDVAKQGNVVPIKFPQVIDSVRVNAEGNVVITDDAGKEVILPDIKLSLESHPEKTVVIQDASGTKYEVQKDAATGQVKVSKLVGGGVSPQSNDGAITQTLQRQYIKALALDVAKYFRKEIGVFLNLSLDAPKLGTGPYAEDIYAALPSCIGEYEKDRTALRAIFDYAGELQTNTSLQEQLVTLLEKDASYKEVVTKNKSVFEKNSSGFEQLLPKEDWKKAKDVSCPHITAESLWYYLQEYLASLGIVGQCAAEGLSKAKDDFFDLSKPKDFSRSLQITLVQSSLCLTAKDKCAADGYWTQFSYGVTNALIQELDLVSMVDGAVMLIGSQLKNKFECVVKGGSVTVIITASSVEEGLHMFSKCALGIDLTPEEWKALYGKAKGYIEKNWDDPYLHGQATVFVATILIPYTKLSKLSKVKLFTKLRGNSKFVGKVDELEKISKVADEGGDVGKVVDEVVKKEVRIPKLGEKLNVSDYATSAKNSAKDMMTPDHIPSYAATKKHIEQKLGRELTVDEAKNIHDNGATMLYETELHQKYSRTYGGRNTSEQILNDSQNLFEAAKRDMNALRKYLLESGATTEEIDQAFQLIHEMNKRLGLY
jgi:Fibronectin type III domain